MKVTSSRPSSRTSSSKKQPKSQDKGKRTPSKPRASVPVSSKPRAATSPAQAGKLAQAAKAGKLDEVSRLLDQGVDPDVLDRGVSALAHAVYWGHDKVVELMLASGASPNVGTSFPAAGGAMHAAAAAGRLELLAALLARRGDPNAPGDKGTTPLDALITNLSRSSSSSSFGVAKPPRKRHLETLRALIAAGGRPTERTWATVMRSDDEEVFELLAAADPDRIRHHGASLLRAAAALSKQLVGALLSRGVPPDLEALQIAAQSDNVAAFEAFLARGADPKATLAGRTAKDLATQHGAKKVLAVMRRRGM